MNVQDREKFFEEFNNGLHRLGRFTLIAGIIVLMAVPFAFGVFVGVMPDMPAFVKGWINVAVVSAIVMAVFEFLIQKKDMKVLENFSLAASMLVAMAAAVVFQLVI